MAYRQTKWTTDTLLDGLEAVNAFARTLGNSTFRVDHWEPNMNSNPTVLEDSATPIDMANSLQAITLGDKLAALQQQQLLRWMLNNTTGDARIRAGVPDGWAVADRTGSGSYGVANDIGIIWPPEGDPIILAIYTVQNTQSAASCDDIIAEATQIIISEFTT